MSHDDVCAMGMIRIQSWQRSRQEMTKRSRQLMSGRVAKEMTEEREEARKAPRAPTLIGTVKKTKGLNGSKGTGEGKSQNTMLLRN